MRSTHNHSTSSTIFSNLSRKNEYLVLEPLLSSNQEDSDQSLNGSFENVRQKDFRSFCFDLLTRLTNFFNQMSVDSARRCCYASLKWIPVSFLLVVLIWSYYAYVVQMCIFTIENVPKKVIYLCIYHPILILFLWSYYRTIFEKPRTPPEQFYIGDVEGERISSVQTIEERRAGLIRLARQANLPLLTRHFDGSVRYCFVCQCIKPDRAHHCSVCEKCVLRYDHHCPWTNSCISYGNYKFFILFLGWALILCLYVSATSLEYFIQFWQNVTNVQTKDGDPVRPITGKLHLLFLFFVAIMFAISISSLFFYHLYLTGKNRTTLESFRSPIFANGPQKEGFHLGLKRNYQQIFGESFLRGIIPISTTLGDGVHYEMNNLILGSVQLSSNRTNENVQQNSEIILNMDSPGISMHNDRNYLLTNQTATNR